MSCCVYNALQKSVYNEQLDIGTECGRINKAIERHAQLFCSIEGNQWTIEQVKSVLNQSVSIRNYLAKPADIEVDGLFKYRLTSDDDVHFNLEEALKQLFWACHILAIVNLNCLYRRRWHWFRLEYMFFHDQTDISCDILTSGEFNIIVTKLEER